MLNWTTPELVELKMDAEISSYQEDRDPLKDGPAFVEGAVSSGDGVPQLQKP